MVGSSEKGNQRLADLKVYNSHLTFLDSLPILKATSIMQRMNIRWGVVVYA